MLSPQSNLRSYVASAENQISVLRNRGLNDDADMFESSIRAAIQSKDPSIMSSLKGLDDIYQANLKSAPKEKGPELPSNLGQSIVDIMQMSEARNIALNPASIRDAATAMQSGDENAMARIYSEFSNDYKSRLEQQDKEKKTLQTLADGTSVLIGETTGTRYTTSGLPISPDAINTNVFNMSVFDKVADPNVQQAMTIPSDTGVAFNREVYQAAPIAEAEGLSPREEKLQMFRKARELYAEGNLTEAADLLNASGAQGLFGGMMTGEDAKDFFESFGGEGAAPRKPKNDTKRKEGETISGWRNRTGLK